MNRFRQHIPPMVDGETPFSFEFETTEQLLGEEWIAQWAKDPGFSHYAMSENHLMAIRDGGREWWVLGFIENPRAVKLPAWDHGIYRCRMPDGTIEDIPGVQVRSSCGGEVTLTDGRIVQLIRP